MKGTKSDRKSVLPMADALAAFYAETHNPIYAWLAIAETGGGMLSEIPSVVSRYLIEAANEITDLAGDNLKTATQKKERVASALNVTGKGNSNAFGRYTKDLEDMRAYNNEGIHRVIQQDKYDRSTRKTALADIKNMSGRTARSRLKNGERLTEIWQKFFPNAPT